MFSTRVLGAAIVVLTVAVVILAGEPLFSLAIAACAVICLWELYGMFQKAGFQPSRRLGAALAIALLLATYLESSTPLETNGLWLELAIAAAVVLPLALALVRVSDSKALANWALTAAGALYIGWLLRYFTLIRHLGGTGSIIDLLQSGAIPRGMAWTAVLFAATWLVDTGAYLIGSRFGRHRMTPVLSPKKTWEGAAAGVVFPIITVLVLVPVLGLSHNYPAIALLGIVVGVLAQIGDLIVSFFKRQVAVKDTGHIIPGHGGLLDRMDSLLLVAIGFYYFVNFFL